MTRRLWPLLLVAAGLTFLPVGSAEASCAAPTLQVAGTTGEDPPTVRTGAAYDVSGRGFVDGCDDTGGGSVLGCSADDEGETETPMRDITLVLRQDGREWELGVADAGSADDQRLGQVGWRVTVPDGVHPGRATLVAGSTTLRVAVGPPVR